MPQIAKNKIAKSKMSISMAKQSGSTGLIHNVVSEKYYLKQTLNELQKQCCVRSCKPRYTNNANKSHIVLMYLSTHFKLWKILLGSCNSG